PAIVSTPTLAATCRTPYEYGNGGPVARGTGPFKWSLGQGPEGLRVDAATGAVEWTPTEAQEGKQRIVLAVESDHGKAEQSYEVLVSCTRLPPTPEPNPEPEPDGAHIEGCGCGAGAGAMALPWVALLGLGLLRRRRQ
ncbi:MAG: MYXO-CTERM sorting domain-containing protein, partial [Myxococcales bacterium]